MHIELEALEKLVVDSDKIFLTPEGEEVLVKLLEIQKQVEDAIDAAKKKLEETALKVNPLFASIQADKIKVYYRSYGARYRVDESLVAEIPKELFKVKTSYLAIPEEIEKYAETHKGMPVGIIENERPKSLTFGLKNSAKEEQE